MPTATCSYKIEDGNFYNILCKAKDGPQKIACCSINNVNLNLAWNWGTGCDLRGDDNLKDLRLRIASAVEPTKSTCSLKISLLDTEKYVDFNLFAFDQAISNDKTGT